MTAGKLLREMFSPHDAVTESEPLWRIVAAWLVIITFFSLPVVVLALHVLSLKLHWLDPQARGTFSYLAEFHRILAGLMAAMLGLNSWDKRTLRALSNGTANGVTHAKP